MRNKLVVGNWKMYGGLTANARLLEGMRAGWDRHADRGGSQDLTGQGARAADGDKAGVGGAAKGGTGVKPRTIAVCVPYPYLAQAQSLLGSAGGGAESAILWGAQNVHAEASGAFTGEVAASMLVDFGCRFAIVGHSERRQLYGETDVQVAAKAVAVLDAGITPIVCVGETLAERDAGATDKVVLRQLDAVLARVQDRAAAMVVAYEPVWAIGTGRTATPDQAQSVHAQLRARLRDAGAGNVSLLYGGSVKAENAAALFGQPDIDGGLVGGASLKADEFLAIAGA
ncbi:MAG: triose-phosphate isomerase [Casimicrobiaceae bacterium]